MIRYFYIILFLSLLIKACSGQKEAASQQHILLPSISLENQEMNEAIVNRNPEYGINGKDGDYLLGEFEIKLTELGETNNGIQISGILLDAESKKELRNGIINMLDKKEKVIEKTHANSNGKFTLTSKCPGECLLEFNYVGYRTLYVDLSKLFNQKK